MVGSFCLIVLCLTSQQYTGSFGSFEDFNIIEIRILVLEEIVNLSIGATRRFVRFGHARKRWIKAVVPRVKSDLVKSIDDRAFKVGHEFEIGTI